MGTCSILRWFHTYKCTHVLRNNKENLICILRASNFFPFFMQISVHFYVPILHLRLKVSPLTQSDRVILIQSHCLIAGLDLWSLTQPERRLSPHLVKREISSVKTSDCTTGRCFNALLSVRSLLSSRFALHPSMEMIWARPRWRSTKINVSVSSAMQRTCLYTCCDFHLQEFWHTPHARTSVARRLYTISCWYSRTNATSPSRPEIRERAFK